MITIKKILWAGGACPYQIEAITDDDKYFYLRYRNGNLRFGVWDNVEKCDHTNYIYSKKVGDQYEDCGGQARAKRGVKAQRGLKAKAQQVQSTIVSGQARAEGPTSPEPRATPWVT
jgi:hypothetical protein